LTSPYRCRSCGSTSFVGPLHGEQGGPLFCIPCRNKWDADYTRDLKQCPDWKLELHGVARTARGGDDPTYLTTDLLDDAIALTHPDRHPSERAEQARLVTSKLLALKPYTLPKPKPRPVTDKNESPNQPRNDPLRISFPCSKCFLTVPFYYCNPCRAHFEENLQKEREARNSVDRRRRAKRRELRPLSTCECGERFKPSRRDAIFCSSACRQRAHRRRVTDNNRREGALTPIRNGVPIRQRVEQSSA
jgi:hypothetical protein